MNKQERSNLYSKLQEAANFSSKHSDKHRFTPVLNLLEIAGNIKPADMPDASENERRLLYAAFVQGMHAKREYLAEQHAKQDGRDKDAWDHTEQRWFYLRKVVKLCKQIQLAISINE